MKLHFSSTEIEQRLLNLFPSGIVVVQSIDTESRLLYVTPDEPRRKDLLVTNHGSFPTLMVPGTPASSEQEDPRNEQDQPANSDVNEPAVQSPQLNECNLSSEKSVNPLLSRQKSVGFLDPEPPQRHSSCSEPSNLSVSQISELTRSMSTQSEARHRSSSYSVPVASAFSEQELHDEESETVIPQSTKLVVELTSKKTHSVHHFLHHSDDKCDLCETPEICYNNYDKEFANEFDKFLAKDPNATLPPADNEDVPGDDFLQYIKVHLQAKKCPSPCTRLWKYCVDNKLFYLLVHAPEGLLIYSKNRQSEVGTVIDTYSGYRKVNLIGSGGFGNVYQYKDHMAVKEEFKQPLITGNLVLFQRIMELEHNHVIKVLEYIVGPYDSSDSESKCFLSVMPFKNQMDLRKQFTKEENLTCVLDYMTVYPDQEKFIFRNYTVLFQHIFKGLCYLKSEEIVHRDIKSSNILVHQECGCDSPLQCICTGDGGVTYLLGDLDLLSLEEEHSSLTYTCDEWVKMAGHDPAGTIGMKPPESFFRNEKGEHVTTHKSDVWSACATIMNVLIGKAGNREAMEQISKFITAVTEGTKNAATSAAESLHLLESIIKMFKSEMKRNTGLVNDKMIQLDQKLNELKRLLTNAEKSLHRSQSFQGGLREVYKEENPLAGILTTAYGAQVLHWKCFKKLQQVYGTQLWTVIELTLDAIVAGIKFVPDRRHDAMEILKCLENVPPVDCSNNG